MISKAELLMGRDLSYPHEYTPEISANLDRLLKALNVVRLIYGLPMIVASGWRPPAINGHVFGGAKHSNHLLGLAADIRDSEGKLRDFVLANLHLMQQLGFYFEDFRWTRGWVHFQIVPPASGHRIFVPYADTKTHPMTNPDAWNGVYDGIYDEAV